VHALQVHRIELEMQNRALRETQAELEQAVRRYSDLYDHLPIGYVTVSPQGRIVEANLAAGELMRRERSRLIGCYLRRFFDEEDAARFAQHLDSCTDSVHATVFEAELKPENAPATYVQLSSRRVPTSPDAEPLIRVAITDVSKLKRTQQLLEDVNREQEAFNYSISHDLRAPLVTISNFARIVLADHSETLDGEAQMLLKRMESAAVRLDVMLRQLLEFSRLGRQEIILDSVNWEDVLNEVLVENRAMIEYRKGEVRLEPPFGHVYGSHLILSQVVTNLLTNALKYTAPDKTPRIRISAEIRESVVVLRVQDDGIGIESKDQERIFRVFERLHNQMTYPGSGVGLAIVRRAVERMNGRVWVESTPHEGSCFFVELRRVL